MRKSIKITCDCGHTDSWHSTDHCTKGTCVCQLGYKTVEARYWARRMKQERDALKKEAEEMELFHRKAWKLLVQRKNFVVVAEDEPFFIDVYAFIRVQKQKEGDWSEFDEYRYERCLERANNESNLQGL